MPIRLSYENDRINDDHHDQKGRVQGVPIDTRVFRLFFIPPTNLKKKITLARLDLFPIN